MTSLDLSEDEPLVPPALKRLNVDPTKYAGWKLRSPPVSSVDQEDHRADGAVSQRF